MRKQFFTFIIIDYSLGDYFATFSKKILFKKKKNVHSIVEFLNLTGQKVVIQFLSFNHR